MAVKKFDYKKEYKDLYSPKSKPVLVDVPEIRFISLEGKGSPESETYQNAIQVLYSLSFTIKMSKMKGMQTDNYFEYVVPPLEGLWWSSDGELDLDDRENWMWNSMIRLPEFVDDEFFNWALAEAENKKPELDFSKAQILTYDAGLCVQIMHKGPYSEETPSMNKIKEFIAENNLIDDTGIERKHHEIYLSNPQRAKPENLKTVLRTPVRKEE